MGRTKKVVKTSKRCVNCHKEKPLNSYFASFKKIDIDGKIPYCKDCVKEMVQRDERGEVVSDSFIKLLKEVDRPFIQNVWNKAKSENRETIGTYFRIIGMRAYNKMIFSDSIFDNNFNSDSDKDKIYSEEWRGSYSRQDLDYLENYLFQLRKDYKIITINHIDYARKIAKASLATDKAYENLLNGSGSEKQFNEMQKIFDTLSKSAQFAESERGINDVSLGGYGVTFDKVEKRQWIPQHIPLMKDDIDKLLDQFGNINKSL